MSQNWKKKHPGYALDRENARLAAQARQEETEAQRAALAEGGQEALNSEIIAQQLATNRLQLEGEFQRGPRGRKEKCADIAAHPKSYTLRCHKHHVQDFRKQHSRLIKRGRKK